VAVKRLVLVGCAALAFATLAFSSGGKTGPTFAAGKSYSTGRGPNTIAVGDLNGDGKPDVATSNENDATVAVLLNRGGGRFGPPRLYDAPKIPYGVEIGDLNGDGKADLIATDLSGEGGVLVFLNQGGGTFADAVLYPAGSGTGSAAIGDLNHDGHLDIAAANSDSRNISILLNNGDGTFAPRVNYAAGESPGGIAIGNLNGDQSPDVVTTSGCGTRKVSVLLNRGDATFGARHEYAAASSCPYALAIGDLDGDGRPDIVSANLFDRYGASVLLNRGHGVFRANANYLLGQGAGSVAIGDLSGDGRPDLAFATGFAKSVSVLVNARRGRFLTRLAYLPAPGPPQSLSAEIADFNGDHRLDIAAANFANSTISILLNKPGVCNVQPVRLLRPADAEHALVRANCRVGTVRHAYSKKIKAGLVMSQSPGFGLVGPRGGRVNLVVSLGKR
jgi:FG-GAP-like repeat/FG-GAP repeat/PASTA domain